MTTRIFIFIASFFLSTLIFGQETPVVNWEKNAELAKGDQVKMVIQNFQGNYTAVGSTKFKGHRGNDILMLHLNEEGKILKVIHHGGKKDEKANALVQTFDGGYVIAGYTESEWPESKGKRDAWLIKVTEKGEMLWDLILGTDKQDELVDVIQDEEGNIYATGYKNEEAYLIKVNQIGEIQWEKTIGPAGSTTTSLVMNPNNELAIVGYVQKKRDKEPFLLFFNIDGEKTSEVNLESWLPAVEEKIEIKTLKYIEPRDIILTNSGNLAITGCIGIYGKRDDMLFMELNAKGEILQFQNYGGDAEDGANSITQTFDDEFLLVGFNSSASGRGERRTKIWLNQISGAGEQKWEAIDGLFGTEQNDDAYSVIKTANGGILVAGYTTKFIEKDAWFLKLEDQYDGVGQSDIKLDISNIEFIEDGKDQTLNANERGYVSFVVTNTGDQNAIGINGKVSAENIVDGLIFPASFQISQLAPGQKKRLTIPVASTELLKSGTSNFSVNLTDPTSKTLQTFTFDINSQEIMRPKLAISSHNFKKFDDAKRADPITLNIEITNEGNAAAEEVYFKFLLPDNAESMDEKSFNVGNLKPGETHKAELSFRVNPFYLSDTLTVESWVWEKTRHFGAVGKYAINLPEIEDIEAVPEMKSVDNNTEPKKAEEDVEPTVEEENTEPIAETSDEPETDAAKETAEIKVEEAPAEEEVAAEAPIPLLEAGPDQDVNLIRWATPDPLENGYEIKLTNKLNFDIKFQVKSAKGLSSDNFELLVNGESAEDFIIEEQAAPGAVESIFIYKANLKLDKPLMDVEMKITFDDKAFISKKIRFIKEEKKYNLHVYAFGIPHEDLKYSVKDATDFAQAFAKQSGENKIFNKVLINEYTSADNTEAKALEEAILDIENAYFLDEKIRKGDVVILFFSSHGFISKRTDQFKIAASNFDARYEDARSIDFEREILEVLERIEVKKMIFLDACRSGSAIADILKDDQPTSKNSNPESEVISNALTNLADASNSITIMTSSSEDQLSYEDPSWENGAFTKAILEAFKNEEVEGIIGDNIKGDENDDQVIYLDELFYFAKERVPVLLKKKDPKLAKAQIPYIDKAQLQQRIPIFVLGENE